MKTERQGDTWSCAVPTAKIGDRSVCASHGGRAMPMSKSAWAMRMRRYTRGGGPSGTDRASSGAVDAISAFSSDGRIAADRLTILTDPKGAIPGYDAILLLAPRRAGDTRFQAALRPLIGAIPVEKMREAKYRVDRDAGKQSPDQAALWLADGLGR